MELCLHATHGDCSAGAMSDEADVLKFKKEHRQLIEDYLKAQLEWDLSTHFEKVWDSDNCKRNLICLGKTGLALKDAGVFEHKWHLRTSWELRYYDEVIEDRVKDKLWKPKRKEQNDR